MVKTSPSNAEGACSIPGCGAKIPHALQPKNRNIKQKQYCNKFSKDFKNGPHQKTSLKKNNKLSFRYSLLPEIKSAQMEELIELARTFQ